MKTYDELPAYLAGWDVALLPFAQNEATRFISPTKTPEYLAAGCQSSPRRCATSCSPYGERGLVRIAEHTGGFGRRHRSAHSRDRSGAARARRHISCDSMSWDRTWADMRTLVEDALRQRATAERARRQTRAACVQRPAVRPTSTGPAAPSMGRADV